MIDVSDLIGMPFVDGGRGPDGYDCWGLAREVYRRCGIALPDYSISARACELVSGTVEAEKSQGDWQQIEIPESPCLIVYRTFSWSNHIGVFIGNGCFVHPRQFGVTVERLSSPLWQKRITGFWQYVGHR